MNKISILIILISIIGIQACEVRSDGLPDKSIFEKSSELKYVGEQNLETAYKALEFTINAGTADIDLKGEPGSQIKLKIGYKEYAPGDAIISLEQGTLKTSSKSGKQVHITSIVGTIPENLNLTFENGTGKILLSNLRNAARLNIESGTGDVELKNVHIRNVDIETGTGKITMNDCVLEMADIETGTGSIYLNGSYVKTAEVESGVGSMYLKDSTIDKQTFESGTGKIHQEGKYKTAM